MWCGCTSKKWSKHVVFLPFCLRKVLRATTARTFSTSGSPKVVRVCGVFNIFTSKCASRHSTVHFFNISTSKSAPRLVCFAHFDLEMYFALQSCALFEHPNFQKCSEREVFLAFSLANVLRATTAYTFPISHLARWLRTRRFSEPTCRPSGATNYFATFLPFCAPASSFF